MNRPSPDALRPSALTSIWGTPHLGAGVARIPVWSGSTRGKVRVSRTGNRQPNAALHRIAVTQLRCHEPAKAYYARRLAAGDTGTEAICPLKRRLALTVLSNLKTNPSTAADALPAAA
jgi:transposase